MTHYREQTNLTTSTSSDELANAKYVSMAYLMAYTNQIVDIILNMFTNMTYLFYQKNDDFARFTPKTKTTEYFCLFRSFRNIIYRSKGRGQCKIKFLYSEINL